MRDQSPGSKRPKSPSTGSSSWKFSEAKARLSLVVQRALDGEPQRIVRDGRDVVFVVREKDYNEATQPRTSLVDLFSALRGMELDLERDKDAGRDLDL